jgi:ribosome-associated protein
MTSDRLPAYVLEAVRAAQDKKAADVVVLDLHEVAGFTDYFVICSGQNPRQVKAIADGVEEALRKSASGRPSHIEGYRRAEWVLLDYFDFIVHVFNPETRLFYALERLWGSAARIAMPDPAPGVEGRARS